MYSSAVRRIASELAAGMAEVGDIVVSERRLVRFLAAAVVVE